jgi:hypothetical protein
MIAVVQLSSDENISRSSPRLTSVVSVGVRLTRMILEGVCDDLGRGSAGGVKRGTESVAYYGPAGQRPHMTVKNAADHEGWFILRHTDRSIEEGTLSDIAINYTLADKKLRMSGYMHATVSGGGPQPEFNL